MNVPLFVSLDLPCELACCCHTAGQPAPPEHSLKLFIFWNTHSLVTQPPFSPSFSLTFPFTPLVRKVSGNERKVTEHCCSSPPSLQQCAALQSRRLLHSLARTQPSQLVPSDPKQFRKQGSPCILTVYRRLFYSFVLCLECEVIWLTWLEEGPHNVLIQGKCGISGLCQNLYLVTGSQPRPGTKVQNQQTAGQGEYT